MDEQAVRKKMQDVIDLVREDVGTIRTGRANPSIVSELKVSVYGGQQTMAVQELASVSAPDSQTIVIEPWDKSIVGDIRKGILAANVGLNPSIDGEIIRISIPPLTTEDREKFVKLLSTKVENGKIMIRQVRGDALQELREADLSEDEEFRQEKLLQDITDQFNEKLEEIEDKKEKELMSV